MPCFVCGPVRGAAPSSGSEDGVFAWSRVAVGQSRGPAATSIPRTVLRITGSQGNSCSTKSPWKSLSGSGVACCSSLSRLISCSAGVRVLVFSVTLRRHSKPSSSLCSCWTCRTGDGPPATLLSPLEFGGHSLPDGCGIHYLRAVPEERGLDVAPQ